MKLLSTRFSRIQAFILLGSIISAPLPVIAEDVGYDEEEPEQEYEQNDPYNNQTDLQKISHPMYDEPEDDDESNIDWENDDEEDDSAMDDE